MWFVDYSCTRVDHNLCSPHELLAGLTVLMNWHTCKSLLNTSGRAVEQLASKSQQSRSKYNSHANTSAKWIFNEMCDRFKTGVSLFTAVTQGTPIAPPTGCGIRPVPNRNLIVIETGLLKLAIAVYS